MPLMVVVVYSNDGNVLLGRAPATTVPTQ